MSNILYVTSFNKQLFDVTGRAMIKSFLGAGIEGDLLVTYEDDIESELPSSEKISLLKLETYDFLNNTGDTNYDLLICDFPICDLLNCN